MGFGQEIRDFLNAYKAGESIETARTDREYKKALQDALVKKTARDNDPDTLAQADAIDKEISRGGSGANRPLLGVPIGIKDESQWFRKVFDSLGTPVIALLLAVIVGMFTLGRGAGMTRAEIMKAVESGLPPVAGIILIVAAGGGFKQVLVDTGIGTMLAEWAKQVNISVLLLAWLLAVLIRLATGSATVATITASSLVLGLVEGLSTPQVSLVVLAVGAGSLFFSHVNDAGFWLVKEYFGMSVGQTIKTWSLMETALSVVGLAVVLILDVFV